MPRHCAGWLKTNEYTREPLPPPTSSSSLFCRTSQQLENDSRQRQSGSVPAPVTTTAQQVDIERASLASPTQPSARWIINVASFSFKPPTNDMKRHESTEINQYAQQRHRLMKSSARSFEEYCNCQYYTIALTLSSLLSCAPLLSPHNNSQAKTGNRRNWTVQKEHVLFVSPANVAIPEINKISCFSLIVWKELATKSTNLSAKVALSYETTPQVEL